LEIVLVNLSIAPAESTLSYRRSFLRLRYIVWDKPAFWFITQLAKIKGSTLLGPMTEEKRKRNGAHWNNIFIYNISYFKEYWFRITNHEFHHFKYIQF